MRFFRKKPGKAPERIVISRTDKIGDMVLSLPAFYMARKMYPEAKIMAVASEYNAPLLKHMDFIDEIVIADNKNPAGLLEKIKRFRPDVFIALYSDRNVLKTAALSGADRLIGPISKPMSWFVYDSGVIQRRSGSIKNEAEYNLDLIRALDPILFDKKFEHGGKIKYSAQDEIKAADFMKTSDINGKFILIHIFSGGSAKNFTPEEYARLICKIKEKLPAVPIILSCGGKEEKEKINLLKHELPHNGIYVYESGENILSFAALIDKCTLFIGGSTGPTHIAGNLKKKTVAVYPAKRSQSKIRWGLFGNESNTAYIVPDEWNKNENYNTKIFDDVTGSILEKTALEAADKFLNEI